MIPSNFTLEEKLKYCADELTMDDIADQIEDTAVSKEALEELQGELDELEENVFALTEHKEYLLSRLVDIVHSNALSKEDIVGQLSALIEAYY